MTERVCKRKGVMAQVRVREQTGSLEDAVIGGGGTRPAVQYSQQSLWKANERLTRTTNAAITTLNSRLACPSPPRSTPLPLRAYDRPRPRRDIYYLDDLAALAEELAQAQEFVDTCKEALELDPSDEDVKADMLSFQQQIPVLKAKIAALKVKQKVAPPPPPPTDTPKSDLNKHPKFQKPVADTPPPPPPSTEENRASFNVGDLVQAKYSADKAWYPATIVSKTGSPADPVYTVKFKGYDEKEQKRKHECLHPQQLRLQFSTALSFPLHPQLIQLWSRNASRAKSVTAQHKSKSSWNDWQKSGPKKPAIGAGSKLKKDSQFRTPDLPNAKVGFTGSGKPMSKDQQRCRLLFCRQNTKTRAINSTESPS
ncbi:hypothetical protein BST61_g9438 [Cercospora zeina]